MPFYFAYGKDMKRVILKNKTNTKFGLVNDPLYGKPLNYLKSGCNVLDKVMGNGYPIGRIVNIVGDKSTGKTQLAIEAMANFNIMYPDGGMKYIEAESAFDLPYADTLGLPIGEVDLIDDKDTVEDLFEILQSVTNRPNIEVPELVIVDSLDALSDRREILQKIDTATMGMGKADRMSQTFRRMVRRLALTNVLVIIISQVRDAINVTFGRKSKRSGGRALDFYASIVLYLAEKQKRTKTIQGIKRIVGIDVVASCDKNKVSSPFRKCQFPITFGYGIENVEACIRYLMEVNRTDELKRLGLGSKPTLMDINKVRDDRDFENEIVKTTERVWCEVEQLFQVKRRKYD